MSDSPNALKTSRTQPCPPPEVSRHELANIIYIYIYNTLYCPHYISQHILAHQDIP
jgi:hypothetical protein